METERPPCAITEEAYTIELPEGRSVSMGRFPDGYGYVLLCERPLRPDDDAEEFNPELKFPHAQHRYRRDGKHYEKMQFSEEAGLAMVKLLRTLLPGPWGPVVSVVSAWSPTAGGHKL